MRHLGNVALGKIYEHFDDLLSIHLTQVMFNRDEREGGDIDAAAAHLLGIDGERVR